MFVLCYGLLTQVLCVVLWPADTGVCVVLWPADTGVVCCVMAC